MTSPIIHKEGKILVFSAPSGSGKTTLIHYLMDNITNLHCSISATSRKPRTGEQNGKDYFFLTPENFRTKINEGDFLEYEEVYHNTFYGTLVSEVEKHLKKGENVVLDVDVKGAINIKRFYGEKALTIFIQPPSIEILYQRLVARNTDSMETINDRISKAKYEISFAPKFDCIVVNDKLKKAQQEVLKVATEFLYE